MKILAILLLTIGLASANPLKTPEDVKALADGIMQKIGASEFITAFEQAAPHWPVGADELEGLAAKSEAQIKQVEPRYGKIVGVEYIGCVQLGKSFRQYSYVVKMEKHMLKWNIRFYKPKDTWIINLLFWDDKPHELFPEFGVVEEAKN